jgi:4-azaleucine resistance transporter AzlC
METNHKMKDKHPAQPNHAEQPPGSFAQGIKDCMPTLLGYLSIGFAAGIVEKTAGLSMLEIALLSLLLYAGSAQFILAGMVLTGFAMIPAVITIFFVNLRHLLFSAALSPYFRGLPPLRSLAIGALLTDETFGVAMNRVAGKPNKPFSIDERWMNGLNLTAYLGWFAASMAGGFLGQWISNPIAWGMDFALPAMFIGLLVLQISSRREILTDLLVALCAVVVVVIVSIMISGSAGIILATVIGATAGMVIERWKSALKSSS